MVVDIFATKGIEYLLVITFLLAWLVFWRLMRQPAATAGLVTQQAGAGVASAPWFTVPTDRFYHRGHTWVGRGDGDTVRVGVDDFAQKLVGVPQRIQLPRIGDRVEQGERGLGLGVDDRTIDILSPVTGRVVALNEAAAREPRRVNEDPYETGWLFDVRLERPGATMANLLPGPLAVDWMERSAEALRSRMTDSLGLVLQDGGLPVVGIARELSSDKWDDIAREFLLTG